MLGGFFAIFATVFGFFYSRNMWFVLERLPAKNRFIVWILIIFYFLVCPIWQINGVRMWTALHVFVYGALPYIYSSKRSRLIWCFISLFVHFSLFTPLVILLVYKFIPRKITPLLLFFIITFFINSIDMEQIRTLLSSYLPDFLQPRVRGYTNEDYVEAFIAGRDGGSLLIRGARFISTWGTTILLVYISTVGKNIIQSNKYLCNLLCFSLFFLGIANMLSLIPSGARFIAIANMFAIPALIFFFAYYHEQKKINIFYSFLLTIISLSLLVPIFFDLRMGCDYYGISLILNPITTFFIEDNTPIMIYIKQSF
ncbi:EpsG family protein [Parabacteroides sp. OttesenSCG-928-G07]|nr:EpsG family protein [Parabacteroides sp. OttesenSCG-928-G07]